MKNAGEGCVFVRLVERADSVGEIPPVALPHCIARCRGLFDPSTQEYDIVFLECEGVVRGKAE